MTHPRFTLVLSGGGMKGLAHIGVFRALEERGLEPALAVGSSMGALVAAAWASGMSTGQMVDEGLRVRRRDVFQVAHRDMAFRRLHAPAVYRSEPLDFLISRLVGRGTFEELWRPLLVNTVDLHSGSQVLWGAPGLRNVHVADAVFASCALPGIFAPRVIQGRSFVDGAVVENLPARTAARISDAPIVAVNVAATSVQRSAAETDGFAATYIRGLEIVMQTQIEAQLCDWKGPPLVLIQPRVEQVSMFAFDRSADLIEAGYRATLETLDQLDGQLDAADTGIPPAGPRLVRDDETKYAG